MAAGISEQWQEQTGRARSEAGVREQLLTACRFDTAGVEKCELCKQTKGLSQTRRALKVGVRSARRRNHPH